MAWLKGSKYFIFFWIWVMLNLSCQEESTMEIRHVDMYNGNVQHTAVYKTPALLNVSGVKWNYKLPYTNSVTPVIGGNMLFAACEGQSSRFPVSYIYALDIGNGGEVWNINQGGIAGAITTAAVFDSIVCFGTGEGYFMAFEIYSGKKKWEFQAGGPIKTEPIVQEGIVYFGDTRGRFYALDVYSGDVKWEFETRGTFFSAPSIYNETVYIACERTVLTEATYIYGLDAGTGELRWEMEGLCESPSALVISNGTILYYDLLNSQQDDQDKQLFAVDIESKKLKWKLSTGKSMPNLPAAFDSVVCLSTNGGDVYMLNIDSGELLWKFTTAGSCSPPIVAEKIIYFWSNDFSTGSGDSNGNYYVQALETDLGKELWKFKVNDVITTGLNIHNKIIYFGSIEGNIYALQ